MSVDAATTHATTATKVVDPTDVFVEFLKKAVEMGGAFQKPEYHGVFQCGTVVRFQLADDTFTSFTEDEEYEFPDHRLSDPDTDLPIILAENQDALNKVLDGKNNVVREGLTPEDYTRAVHTAYRTLIDDGYPYPGEEGADRMPMPLPGGPNRAMVMFPARGPMVFNIVAPALLKAGCAELNIGQLTSVGGDFRRNDYMQPKLVTLITPTLQVHRLE